MSGNPKTFNLGSTLSDTAGLIDDLFRDGQDQAAPPVPVQSSPANAGEATGLEQTEAGVLASVDDKFVIASAADPFTRKLAAGVIPTLEDCEQHIVALTTQWLLGVGRALVVIRDYERFLEKGYSSFTSYIRAEHQWHPTYVSRVIADIPVLEALSRHGVDRDVNEGQATALRPVWEKHGEEALFEVWDATPGKRSAAALEQTARAKGYLDQLATSHKPTTTFAAEAGKLRAILQRVVKRDLAQTAASEDPDEVKKVVAELRVLLDEIEKKTL
ncbi:hypothetical protein [Streptosporangium sp. NPDC023615]|uniref:hypothetical protein n=1 Tax=Streptosporangium sp. NPDC023615 TaxID=3154794 RepID=UPI003433EE37